MKISATSALVLNWTDYRIYQGPKVRKYIDALDLSEGKEMLGHFSELQHYMHTQTVSGRKFFMMKETTAFLSALRERGLSGQVIVPGAGIAPFSAAIAELFPDCKIWDIDLYSMNEKAALLSPQFDNIGFLTADLEDVPAWTGKLIEKGFDTSVPSIMVLEGITYYLTKESLLKTLTWAASHGMHVIGEFGLPPEEVHEKHRIFPELVFKTIANLTSHPGITFYSRAEFAKMLDIAGFRNKEMIPMRAMQIERTHSASPFEEENSCWIEPFKAD